MDLTHWRDRLQQSGLGSVVRVFLEAAEPLTPIGAQLLWIAQPTLGLFMDSGRITTWAEQLEDPHTLARLREDWFKHE